jgi:hypothetical protein
VTQDFKKDQIGDNHASFWDTKGFENEEGNQIIPRIIEWLSQTDEGRVANPDMPVALLCIAQDRPIASFHRTVFSLLSPRMAVIIVITKAVRLNEAIFAEGEQSFSVAVICEVNTVADRSICGELGQPGGLLGLVEEIEAQIRRDERLHQRLLLTRRMF